MESIEIRLDELEKPNKKMKKAIRKFEVNNDLISETTENTKTVSSRK